MSIPGLMNRYLPRREAIANRIAYLLPKRVVYFAFIRLWAHATTGVHANTVATKIPADECLRRWEAQQ